MNGLYILRLFMPALHHHHHRSSTFWMMMELLTCFVIREKILLKSHCWGLLRIAEHCWVLLSIAVHCWALLRIAEHCWGLLKITEDCWRLLSIAEDCWALLSIWSDKVVNLKYPLKTKDWKKGSKSNISSGVVIIPRFIGLLILLRLEVVMLCFAGARFWNKVVSAWL